MPKIHLAFLAPTLAAALLGADASAYAVAYGTCTDTAQDPDAMVEIVLGRGQAKEIHSISCLNPSESLVLLTGRRHTARHSVQWVVLATGRFTDTRSSGIRTDSEGKVRPTGATSGACGHYTFSDETGDIVGSGYGPCRPGT